MAQERIEKCREKVAIQFKIWLKEFFSSGTLTYSQKGIFGGVHYWRF
jgi:hypothetical protein